jgi:arylsulfatase A-like enzyme
MQPIGRGFDEFVGFLGGADSYVDAVGDRDPANVVLRGREKVASIEYLTTDLGREAVAFIEKNRDQPFFLYLPFNAPHGPFQAPEKYTSRFSGIGESSRSGWCLLKFMRKGWITTR